MSKQERQKVRHLLIIHDRDSQRTIPLNDSTYLIGRDPSNSIVLDYKLISRQHAILLRIPDASNESSQFRVIDGDLQGKRSTNGIIVNGQRAYSHNLKHEDTINFGGCVSATYYAFSNISDADFSKSFEVDDAASFLVQEGAKQTLVVPDEEEAVTGTNESALVRLASFPELIPNAIIETDFSGAITYLNPAALVKFPDLSEKREHHPILAGLLDRVRQEENRVFIREVMVGDEVFEQLVHYLAESELIRSFIVNITVRKQTETALRQAEEKYRSIFENAVEGIFQTSIEGRFLTVNPTLARIYGYDSPADLINSIDNIERQLYVKPSRRAEFQELVHLSGAVTAFEAEVYRKDGQVIWISENARAIYNAAGRIIRYEGTVEDITKQKTAQKELLKRDQLLQGAAEATSCLLIDADFNTAIAKALATLGLAAEVDRVYLYEHHLHPDSGESLVNKHYEWVRDAVPTSTHEQYWQSTPRSSLNLSRWYTTLTKGNAISGITRDMPPEEQLLLRQDQVLSILVVPVFIGQRFWGCIGFDDCHHEREWSKNERSILFAIAASISGAIQRQQTEATIRYQAFHDLLTGLPNRVLFIDRLEQALSNAERRQEKVAVMFLDLDRFKTINDSLGHSIGDQLLQSVAERLNDCLRKGDTVARWGGDEFTILLPNVQELTHVSATAQRILAALDSLFNLDGHELYISTSIGIALYGQDGHDAETLIRHADAALYRAKEEGRNNYQFYTASMSSMAPELLALENFLRSALERDEFVLRYQPQVNLKTGQITGVEALLRWHHPEMGLIDPRLFMPVAEENGLILPIGEWVIRQACLQNKLWQDANLPSITMSVNLSPKQFYQSKLVETVGQILNETGLSPELLKLEITETTAIRDVEFTKGVLNRLREMGVKIAMDDFGTGYSSLSHLKQFPLHVLKIDKSFIQDLEANSKDSQIVTAIIALAKGLNLSIVAEGVETAAQLQILQELDCEEVQGFYFYRPLEPERVTELLHTAFLEQFLEHETTQISQTSFNDHDNITAVATVVQG